MQGNVSHVWGWARGECVRNVSLSGVAVYLLSFHSLVVRVRTLILPQLCMFGFQSHLAICSSSSLLSHSISFPTPPPPAALLKSPDVFLIMFMIWPYGCILCLCVFVFVCAVKRSTRVHWGLIRTSITELHTILEPFHSWRSQTLCSFCCGLFVCLLVHVHNKKNMHTISMCYVGITSPCEVFLSAF